jgi:hypothetical protein
MKPSTRGVLRTSDHIRLKNRRSVIFITAITQCIPRIPSLPRNRMDSVLLAYDGQEVISIKFCFSKFYKPKDDNKMEIYRKLRQYFSKNSYVIFRLPKNTQNTD